MIENMDKLSEIGVVGVIIVWVIREVAAIVKAKTGNAGSSHVSESCLLQLRRIEDAIKALNEDVEEAAELQRKIAMKLYELHKWHDVDEPGTGIKVWHATGMKEDIKAIKLQLQNRGQQL